MKLAPTPPAGAMKINLDLYVTGDLAFYAMVLGKEDMSGHWCFLCKLSKIEWDELLHEPGEIWVHKALREMADDIEKKGADRKGVKGFVFWPFIPIDRSVFCAV